MRFWKYSASEIANAIKTKKVSAFEVTKAHLDRLQEVNPKINAVVQEMPEEALHQASRIDKKITNGDDLGLLAGVPVTVKVNIDQKNYAGFSGVQI